MRLFLLFISLNIFGQNVECSGYVFDKPINNFKFTQCSEDDLPVWGVANYEDGASFQGFFGSDGKFSKGILTYPSGNYFIGKFNTPEMYWAKKSILLLVLLLWQMVITQKLTLTRI